MTQLASRKLTEEMGVVNGLSPDQDYGSAGFDTDSVKMDKYRYATFIFNFGDITGNSILKFYAGATDGAKTTAIAFRTRLADADEKAAGADGYADEVSQASTGLTLTAATYDDKILIAEIDAADLPADKPFLTGEVDATATVMECAVVVLMRGARFNQEDMPNAIP